jgi:hypothetical protein
MSAQEEQAQTFDGAEALGEPLDWFFQRLRDTQEACVVVGHPLGPVLFRGQDAAVREALYDHNSVADLQRQLREAQERIAELEFMLQGSTLSDVEKVGLASAFATQRLNETISRLTGKPAPDTDEAH